MRKINKIIIFVIVLFSLIQIVLAVPNSINIQGKLTDSSDKVKTGTFNFSFGIYDNFTSGNKLYESNITATSDARGLYDVILNNVNISFDKQLYLGIKVATDSEMTPRGNLTAVPYSFRANTSEDLDKNKSYTVSGLNITGNLTLLEKITFGLGEIIDNIVDGWLRVTGNLNVTQNVTAKYFIGNGSLLTGVTLPSELDNSTILRLRNNQTLGQVVGSTTRDFSGNISNGSNADTDIGYVRADLLCLDEFGAGAHMCSSAEIIRTNAESKPIISGTYWISTGPPGFTAEANDCSGWTTNSTTSLGPFWNYDLPGRGQGKLTNCGQVKKIICCRT